MIPALRPMASISTTTSLKDRTWWLAWLCGRIGLSASRSCQLWSGHARAQGRRLCQRVRWSSCRWTYNQGYQCLPSAHGRKPCHHPQASGRKSKKLAALSTAVDGDDWQHFRTFTGKQPVSSKPPFGKTWIKQLLAGQMSLTMLCAIAGIMIGIPLDATSSKWDVSTTAGIKHLNQDLRKEDPYCLVLTTMRPMGQLEPFQLDSWWQSCRNCSSSTKRRTQDLQECQRDCFSSPQDEAPCLLRNNLEVPNGLKNKEIKKMETQSGQIPQLLLSFPSTWFAW